MARAAKDYEYLHCKIERPLAEQLSLYADETRRPKTSVVEMALQKLFDEWEVDIEPRLSNILDDRFIIVKR